MWTRAWTMHRCAWSPTLQLGGLEKRKEKDAGDAACATPQPSGTSSRRVLLQGLMMALAHPGTRVVGVSAVHGNAGVAAVGRNIARVLALCGAAGVPFYIGAGEPLLGPRPKEPSEPGWYGSDGLGDAPQAPPAADSIQLQPRPGHAAEHLARAAQVRWRLWLV